MRTTATSTGGAPTPTPADRRLRSMLVIAAMCASASATGQVPAHDDAGVRSASSDVPALFACERAEQCVLVPGTCPGLVAVNRDRRAAAEAAFAALRPRVECASPRPGSTPTTAVCRAGRCVTDGGR